MKQKISITINDKILRDVDSIVDNIYIRNRSQAFEYLIKRAFKERKIAVILAGESKNNPANELKHRYSLKVNHSTIVEKTIRKLSDSGFKKIYIVSDHLTLTNIFKIIGDGSDFKTHIEFIDEEIQEGSSSALKLLKGIYTKCIVQIILRFLPPDKLFSLQSPNNYQQKCARKIPPLLFSLQKYYTLRNSPEPYLNFLSTFLTSTNQSLQIFSVSCRQNLLNS